MKRTLPTLFLLLLTSACFERVRPPQPIAPLEALGQIQNDFALLVDLREKEESESTGYPLKALPHVRSKIEENAESWKAFVGTLDKSKSIILIGNSPRELDRVALKLSEAHFEVKVLGAFSVWKNAGLPMQVKPEPKND